MAYEPDEPIVKRQKTFHKKYLSDVIPGELVREILLRLGPERKHAIRCGVVCKHWLSLISEPEFGDAFTRRHGPKAAALLFQKHHYEENWSSFDSRFYQVVNPDDTNIKVTNSQSRSSSSSFLRSGDDAVIRGSSGDLVLVSRPNTDYYSYYNRNKLLKFYICNGVSKKQYCLPLPPRGILKLLRCALVCCNDNNNSQYYEAVVFCETTNHGYDYFNWVRRDEVRMTVFSTKTGRWSPLAVVHYPPRVQEKLCMEMEIRAFNSAVPFKGWLYWLGERDADDQHAIVGIDPRAAFAGKRNCWQFIHLPDQGNCSIHRSRMGACGDKLRLADVSKAKSSEGGFVLRVWELIVQLTLDDDHDLDYDDYEYSNNHSWSLVYDEVMEDTNNVNIEETQRPDFCMLALHPTNPDVVFVQCDRCYVFRYDLSLRKGEIVGRFPHRESAPGWDVSSYALSVPAFWPTHLPSLHLY